MNVPFMRTTLKIQLNITQKKILYITFLIFKLIIYYYLIHNLFILIQIINTNIYLVKIYKQSRKITLIIYNLL